MSLQEEAMDAAGGKDYMPRDVEEPLSDVLRDQGSTDGEGQVPPLELRTVSWMRQFSFTIHKNVLLIVRRPVMLSVMMLSSVAAAICGWLLARPKDDAIFGPLTPCGLPDPAFVRQLPYDDQTNVQTSQNDGFRDGIAVALMSLGPMINAVCVFMVLHEEFSNQLIGVLRALGLRDSVYWASWYVLFMTINCINAGMVTITIKSLPLHAFENIYAGGIFASYFFLHFALVPTSFFLAAAMRHIKRGVVWMILVILIAVWITPIFVGSDSSIVDGPNESRYDVAYPSGFIWANKDTKDHRQGCNYPLVSEERGGIFEFEEERRQIRDDEFFVGCYVSPSWHSDAWNPVSSKQRFTLGFHFLTPYFHFHGMWSAFIGFTAMPGNSFKAEHFGKSPEDLSIEALPAPPDPRNGKTSKLFEQGRTVRAHSTQRYFPCTYVDNVGCIRPSNCPLPDREGAGLCSYMDNCASIEGTGPIADSPSAATLLGYLVIDALLYLFLAAYVALVFPGLNGKPEKFYFFLLPGYWLGTSSSDSDNRAPGSRRDAITIDNVRKVYGQAEALKGISMTMNRGEVTALLGHNGAGKTTLSHVISCEIGSTSGNVHVFGKSVNSDSYAVRCMVGLCKQDDYLWDNLTAREHLELFAGLRGVPDEDLSRTVQRWLESVNLATEQLQRSSAFSGGMKRRLSVALATIGERQLIILDEPTTGMDPLNRRFVWRHIDEIKENRVVILTTHAMEEADLLADEVAIMKKGELAAFGSPLQLKTEHGSALQFSLLVEKEDVQDTEAHLRSCFGDNDADVTIDAASAGNITVNIQRIESGDDQQGVSVELLASFVSWLNGDESLVQEYGFSNSSLEEVFLKVTGDSAALTDEAMNSSAQEGGQQDETEFNQNQHPETEDDHAAAQAKPDRLQEIAGFKPRLTVMNQVISLLRFLLARNWIYSSSIANYIIYALFIATTIVAGLAANGSDNRAALTLPIVLVSFMFVGICGMLYSDRNEGLFHLMRTQGMLAQSFLISIMTYAYIVQTLFTFIVLSIFAALPIFSSQDVCPKNDWECSSSFGQNPQLHFYDTTFLESFDDRVDNKPVTLRAYREPAGYGPVVVLVVLFSLSVPGSVLAGSFIPGYKLPMAFLGLVCIVASLLPLVIYFVHDQSDQERELDCANDFQEYSGRPLFTIENITEFCDTGINSTAPDEYFMNCVGFAINGYQQYCTSRAGSILPQFGLFQGLSMVYTGRVTFISEPETYVEDVLIPNMKGVSCTGSTCEFPYAKRTFTYVLGYMLLGVACISILGVLCTFVLAFPTGPVLRARAHMSHFISILLCRSSGADEATQRDADHRSDGDEPNGNSTSKRNITKTTASTILDEVKQESREVRELIAPMVTKHREGEVEEGTVNETVTLIHSQIPRDDCDPILMHNLSKTYPALGGRPPKKALEKLDMHVPRGQCLGFLGKNGAGKTTALNILAGAHDPTDGFALVGGYDAALERISVFERLGNCPQFDVVWRGQTVQTHLEFFARLKGLPSSEVKRVAHGIAEAVGLGTEGVYTRKAGALSGGMRRRLSIAMSLIGSPSVLVLDEPTTGLDPSTRNNIWALVNSFNSQDRSTVITTHMMVEADTLCNRIAIIADGKLKVIGNQQHLKDRYGSGYLLQLNLVKSDIDNQESAMAFVLKRLHSDATLATKQAKTLHVNLPRDLDLERVFRALYSPESKTEGRINQFLLSQSSLEDVFIALGD